MFLLYKLIGIPVSKNECKECSDFFLLFVRNLTAATTFTFWKLNGLHCTSSENISPWPRTLTHEKKEITQIRSFWSLEWVVFHGRLCCYQERQKKRKGPTRGTREYAIAIENFRRQCWTNICTATDPENIHVFYHRCYQTFGNTWNNLIPTQNTAPNHLPLFYIRYFLKL